MFYDSASKTAESQVSAATTSVPRHWPRSLSKFAPSRTRMVTATRTNFSGAAVTRSPTV